MFGGLFVWWRPQVITQGVCYMKQRKPRLNAEVVQTRSLFAVTCVILTVWSRSVWKHSKKAKFGCHNAAPLWNKLFQHSAPLDRTVPNALELWQFVAENYDTWNKVCTTVCSEALLMWNMTFRATFSFVLSVCLSVCSHGKTGSHWTDFYEIWYLSIFPKSVKKIRVLLQSERNIG
jgi:hypothetical protein